MREVDAPLVAISWTPVVFHLSGHCTHATEKQNKVPKIWYKIQALCYGFDEVDFHARINDFPSFMVSCLENIRLKLKSCCPQGNSLRKSKDTEEASNYRALSYLK